MPNPRHPSSRTHALQQATGLLVGAALVVSPALAPREALRTKMAGRAAETRDEGGGSSRTTAFAQRSTVICATSPSEDATSACSALRDSALAEKRARRCCMCTFKCPDASSRRISSHAGAAAAASSSSSRPARSLANHPPPSAPERPRLALRRAAADEAMPAQNRGLPPPQNLSDGSASLAS